MPNYEMDGDERAPKAPDRDMLTEMMKTQGEFQKRMYGADFFDWDAKLRAEYIKEHSIHLTQELHEMLYELPYFKPWKDYSKMEEGEICTAFAKARLEFIDMWHFMMNIAIQLGFNASEIAYMYYAKQKENNTRQDVGYSYNVSYRDGGKE